MGLYRHNRTTESKKQNNIHSVTQKADTKNLHRLKQNVPKNLFNEMSSYLLVCSFRLVHLLFYQTLQSNWRITSYVPNVCRFMTINDLKDSGLGPQIPQLCTMSSRLHWEPPWESNVIQRRVDCFSLTRSQCTTWATQQRTRCRCVESRVHLVTGLEETRPTFHSSPEDSNSHCSTNWWLSKMLL